MALNTRKYKITLEQKKMLEKIVQKAEPYAKDEHSPEWEFDGKRMSATMAKSLLDNAEIVDKPPTP